MGQAVLYWYKRSLDLCVAICVCVCLCLCLSVSVSVSVSVCAFEATWEADVCVWVCGCYFSFFAIFFLFSFLLGKQMCASGCVGAIFCLH